MISVLVCGAGGKMGQEVVKSILQDKELELVGAVDVSKDKQALCELVPTAPENMLIEASLATSLERCQPDVVVDFTTPAVVFENAKTVLQHGSHLVIGTTGLTAEQRNTLHEMALDAQLGVLVAPNFSLGAIMMMQAAAQIARYLPNVEIIELHHNQKHDAPSGTAKLTAEKIAASRKEKPQEDLTRESLPGARGALLDNIRIHSVRLPGYVAHQEVIFGGLGETLTIRHDSLHRESFMPGVMLAVKKVGKYPGLTYGLEHYL